MDGDGAVEVYVARDLPHAYQVLAMLQDDGIAATVVGESLGSAAADLGLSFNALPRIWVRVRDENRARTLLDRWDERMRAPAGAAAEDAEDWTCWRCGEQVESAFEACWNCEAERPGS